MSKDLSTSIAIPMYIPTSGDKLEAFHRRYDNCISCWSSNYDNSIIPMTVLVMNNVNYRRHPGDETIVEKLRRRGFRVLVTENSFPLPLARAVLEENLKKAGFEYQILIDDDITITKDYSRELVERVTSLRELKASHASFLASIRPSSRCDALVPVDGHKAVTVAREPLLEGETKEENVTKRKYTLGVKEGTFTRVGHVIESFNAFPDQFSEKWRNRLVGFGEDKIINYHAALKYSEYYVVVIDEIRHKAAPDERMYVITKKKRALEIVSSMNRAAFFESALDNKVEIYEGFDSESNDKTSRY